MTSPQLQPSKSLCCKNGFSIVVWHLLAAMAIVAFPLALSANTVNLTISCEGPGKVSPVGTFIEGADTDVTVTATPNLGCVVFNWYIDGLGAGWDTNVEQIHLGDTNMDVKVVFQRITNQVHTFAGSNGKVAPSGDSPQLVGWGDSLLFNATPDAHYHVATWSLDGKVVQTGGNTYTLNNVIAEHWMEVAFAQDIYTVSATASSHGSLSPTGTLAVSYGDDLSFSATPDPGYDVVVWSVDGQPVLTNQTSLNLSSVSSDHTVQVTFSAPLLTIAPASGNKVVVSWPDAMSVYILQENADLASTIWINSAAKPVSAAGRQQMQLPRSAACRFYKLAQQ